MVGAPYLHIFVFRHLKCEPLRQHDHGTGRGEMLYPPELAGSLRFVDRDVDFILQGVASRERAHGYVLFLEVAVERSFATNGGSHIDGVSGGSVYGGAIRLVYPHQRDVRGFLSCGIAE